MNDRNRSYVVVRTKGRSTVSSHGRTTLRNPAYPWMIPAARWRTSARPRTTTQPTSQGGIPIGPDAARATIRSSSAASTSWSVKRRTLRRACSKAANASAVARSLGGGSAVRSAGDRPRPVTVTLCSGHTIMQCPHAMHPSGLSAWIPTWPASSRSTSVGQISAQQPQSVQVVRSMVTIPASG